MKKNNLSVAAITLSALMVINGVFGGVSLTAFAKENEVVATESIAENKQQGKIYSEAVFVSLISYERRNCV